MAMYGAPSHSLSCPPACGTLEAAHTQPARSINGVLDKTAFNKYGVPELSATFAYAMFIANAAIGALITHCFLFWGKDIWKAYKDSRKGIHHDRHHDHMVKNYKETPWWWFAIVLVVSFVWALLW